MFDFDPPGFQSRANSYDASNQHESGQPVDASAKTPHLFGVRGIDDHGLLGLPARPKG
jgi:hypothetical protein